jgi:glycosyltransferase involved in cell wall biosynthesis
VSKRVLFLVAHRPERSPGQRFRFEQYLGYLKQNGYDCQISYLIDEKDDEIFYANGKYFRKSIFLVKSLRQRINDLKIARNFDIVFLYREAHMLGTTWFERKLRQTGAKLILDFDDSIWLKDISNGNRNIAFLKRPKKTAEIIMLCDSCIVGNQFLSDYAKKYNQRVYIIPTTLDTDYYRPDEQVRNSEKIIIGWTGSSTTIKHFSLAIPYLKILREKFGDRIGFRLISDEPFEGKVDGLEYVKWNRETEVFDLNRIDIGIMPLPDDDWAKGKCGFKGLQYMALKKPAVLSPVGVNNEIIQQGKNGFLASTQDEWVNILSMLVENKELRKQIGEEGRKTVVQRFSFNAHKEKYLEIFNELILQNP